MNKNTYKLLTLVIIVSIVIASYLYNDFKKESLYKLNSDCAKQASIF